MPKVLRWILAGAGGVLAFYLLIMVAAECFHRFGPPASELRQRDVVLAPLLREHASRQQVTQALALEFTDYSDTERRTKLLDTFSGARERARPDSTILFHATMWTTTFLFFDAQDRLQDYYIGNQ